MGSDFNVTTKEPMENLGQGCNQALQSLNKFLYL